MSLLYFCLVSQDRVSLIKCVLLQYFNTVLTSVLCDLITLKDDWQSQLILTFVIKSLGFHHRMQFTTRSHAENVSFKMCVCCQWCIELDLMLGSPSLLWQIHQYFTPVPDLQCHPKTFHLRQMLIAGVTELCVIYALCCHVVY